MVNMTKSFVCLGADGRIFIIVALNMSMINNCNQSYVKISMLIM